jgi:hypothetical protein
MITHHFTDAADGELKSGYWADDHGRQIVSWVWDSDERTLMMQCASHGRKHDLSSLSAEPITKQKLRERLPRLAIAFAEEINQKRYDV